MRTEFETMTRYGYTNGTAFWVDYRPGVKSPRHQVEYYHGNAWIRLDGHWRPGTGIPIGKVVKLDCRKKGFMLKGKSKAFALRLRSDKANTDSPGKSTKPRSVDECDWRPSGTFGSLSEPSENSSVIQRVRAATDALLTPAEIRDRQRQADDGFLSVETNFPIPPAIELLKPIGKERWKKYYHCLTPFERNQGLVFDSYTGELNPLDYDGVDSDLVIRKLEWITTGRIDPLNDIPSCIRGTRESGDHGR